MTAISIIVPAYNEADWIGRNLAAILASEGIAPGRPVQVIVAANACRDDTVAVAGAYSADFAARGWTLDVLDIPDPGKVNAINHAEAIATGDIRIFIDADIRISPQLVALIADALAGAAPAYAGARPGVEPAETAVTRAYSRFWLKLPFLSPDVVPGCGVYAVNRAGRARWGVFPAIISDDTFVRLNFTAAERRGVPAPYWFPMPEGFTRLVKVRRRQNLGVSELMQLYPALAANDTRHRTGPGRLAAMALRDPLGFAVYAAVALAVRMPGSRQGRDWARGR